MNRHWTQFFSAPNEKKNDFLYFAIVIESIEGFGSWKPSRLFRFLSRSKYDFHCSKDVHRNRENANQSLSINCSLLVLALALATSFQWNSSSSISRRHFMPFYPRTGLQTELDAIAIVTPNAETCESSTNQTDMLSFSHLLYCRHKTTGTWYLLHSGKRRPSRLHFRIKFVYPLLQQPLASANVMVINLAN